MDAKTGARLRREIQHHQEIASRAEELWNWDTPAGRRRAERRAERLSDAGRIIAGQRVLELGCGTGVFLEKVARTGARIHSLDLTLELLERARARMGRSGECLRFVRGDAMRLPYRDSTFDAVYGSSVLHHLELEATVREIFRVLRPGGRLVFAEPNLLNPQVLVTSKIGWLRDRFGFSPDEMAFTRFHCARMLRRVGFAEVSVRPFDFLHPSIPGSLVGVVSHASLLLERVPLVREIAGSILISARRPSGEAAAPP